MFLEMTGERAYPWFLYVYKEIALTDQYILCYLAHRIIPEPEDMGIHGAGHIVSPLKLCTQSVPSVWRPLSFFPYQFFSPYLNVPFSRFFRHIKVHYMFLLFVDMHQFFFHYHDPHHTFIVLTLLLYKTHKNKDFM